MSADALPGSCFHGDPQFCPECGTVLPVPGVEDVLSCRRCGYDIGVSELADQVVTSSVVFNSLESSSTAVMSEEEGELKGPVIDRRCSRCGREGMVYHTRQMRSADEGQTVFYTCTHCRQVDQSIESISHSISLSSQSVNRSRTGQEALLYTEGGGGGEQAAQSVWLKPIPWGSSPDTAG
ncbi:RPA12 polymerase, partial [Atractosteus spatula]|nr:RPA12 polymerase [Atractosteus spatula]